MFIQVTAMFGQMKGQKVDILVDKVFGVTYSDVMQSTIIISDTGSSIPVSESAESIKEQIKNLKAIKPQVI